MDAALVSEEMLQLNILLVDTLKEMSLCLAFPEKSFNRQGLFGRLLDIEGVVKKLRERGLVL